MNWFLLSFLGTAGAIVVACCILVLLVRHRINRRHRVHPKVPTPAPLTWMADPRAAARLHRRLAKVGRTAGVVADDHRVPHKKLRRPVEQPPMVDLAEQFHLPVVNLVDVPGFRIGLEAEKEGVMRAGVRALTAIAQSTVPWCSIIIRKAFGVAGGGHQNAERFNFRYAWPSAQWGSLPIEGGLEVAYKAEIEAASDPEAARQGIERRVRGLTSPFRSAEAFVVEDIIDPADTRAALVEFANIAAPLRQPGAARFGYRP